MNDVRRLGAALACTAILLAGCEVRQAAQKPAPAGQPGAAGSGSSAERPTDRPSVMISRNDLFFDGKPPKAGEAINISPQAIRGSWLAKTPRGEVKLVFGDANVPAWTLNAANQMVDNPDGSASWSFFGTVGPSAAPWGLAAADRYGWISWPSSEKRRLAEFRLLRRDLLHVTGFTPVAGGVELDIVLIKAPGGGNWNHYGLHSLTALTANELVDVQPADDPTVKADAPADFQGEWVAQQDGGKVVLTIADHRVLTARREGGAGVKLQTGEAPRQWAWIVDYDRGEACLQIKEHEAFLRLTKGGRLHYRHFGGHGPGGEGGRTIDVLFVRQRGSD